MDGPLPGTGIVVFDHHDGQGVVAPFGKVSGGTAKDDFVVIREVAADGDLYIPQAGFTETAAEGCRRFTAAGQDEDLGVLAYSRDERFLPAMAADDEDVVP